MIKRDIDATSFPNIGNNPFYNKEFSIGNMLPQTDLSDKVIIRASIQPYIDGLNLNDYDLTKVHSYVERASLAKSDLDSNHRQKGKMSLGQLRREKLTENLRKKYSSEYKFLRHFYGDDEWHNTYAWFDGEKLVGAICVSKGDKKFDNQIWLSDFYITPEYRSYGLGDQMLDFACNNCKVDALGVAHDNMIARRLYEKHGFKYGKDIGKQDKAGGTNLLMYKESAEEVITENWIFSQDNFEINLDQWRPGNPLWITGNSGDGKSTLAAQMAKEYNAEIVTSDIVLVRVGHDPSQFQAKLQKYKEAHGFVLTGPAMDYVATHPDLPYNLFDPITKKWDNAKLLSQMLGFYYWFMKESATNPKYKNKLYIIEGCDICQADPEIMVTKPLIVCGGSRLRGIWRRSKRDSMEKNCSILRSLFKYIKNYNLSNRHLDDNKEFFRDSISALQESVKEPEPTKDGFMMAYRPGWPQVWNSLVVENGKRYRERVETLILKDGKVFLHMKDNDYKLPGGGTEPKESMMKSAIRECQEEARITPKNMRYYGSYKGEFDKSKTKINEVYDGYIAHVFVGEFGSKFTGHVNKEDQDPEISNDSCFYSLTEVNLKPLHVAAIIQYLRETGYAMKEYVSESVKRSELSDSEFGIPQERKYPMPDRQHTISAMKLFNHCEKKYEEQLAKHIIKNIRKYDIDPSFVGPKNRLRKYLEKAHLISEGVITVGDTNYLLDDMLYEFFGDKPKKSDADELFDRFFGEASMTEDIKSVPDDIEPMVKKLENKHYRVKYASPGHENTRFDNDRNKDGVINGKLVSTGRIIFERDYHFDSKPEGWEWKRLSNGFKALYVKPFTYSGSDGHKKEAFTKWKKDYLDNLLKWIEDLPMQDSENPRNEPKDDEDKSED